MRQSALRSGLRAAFVLLSLSLGLLARAEEKAIPSLDEDWGTLLKARTWVQEKFVGTTKETTILQFSSTTENARDPETRRSGRTAQVTIMTLQIAPRIAQDATTVSYTPFVVKQFGEFRILEFSGEKKQSRSMSRRYRLENGKLILDLASESKERDVVGEFVPTKE